MSELDADPIGRALAERQESIARAIQLAEGRFPAESVEAARNTLTKTADRLRHGTTFTVIALAGPTGSGKSSLFNALVGAELSNTGVRRPTTSETHAAIFGPADASGLLDWLEIKQRYRVGPSTGTEPASALKPTDAEGLVLLDLPDHDSTAAKHKIEVDRLVGLVDLLVWITEPQKYADLAMHDRYIRPLAGYGNVMRFVLSKSDTLSAADLEACVLDLGQKLVDDGIEAPIVVPVSVQSGAGVDDLVGLVNAEVADKRAAVARLEADLDQAAAHFASVGPDRAAVPDAAQRELVSALGHAAGTDRAAETVAAQHQRNGAAATGWPATRWMKRFRRQPIADIPVAGRSATAVAEVDVALRDVAEATSEEMGAPWPSALRTVASAQRDPVVEQLGRVTNRGTRAALDKPKWWGLAAWWQRLMMLAVMVGGGWLLALAILGGFLKLDTDPFLIDTPGIDWMPLPSLLLIGGIVLGLVGAFVARIANNVGAARRGRSARKALEKDIAVVAAEHLVAPLEGVLAERAELQGLLS